VAVVVVKGKLCVRPAIGRKAEKRGGIWGGGEWVGEAEEVDEVAGMGECWVAV